MAATWLSGILSTRDFQATEGYAFLTRFLSFWLIMID